MAYHSSFACTHFFAVLEDAHKSKVRNSRPIRAMHLLTWMWSAVSPWDENPVIVMAHSHMAAVVGDDDSNRRKLLRKLVRAGAITKLKRTKWGAQYKLNRPDVAVLSLDLQAELAGLHPADYRRDPATLTEDVHVKKRRTEEATRLAREEHRAEQKRVTKYLAGYGMQRSTIARAFAKTIGLKKNALRYSGRGAEPVTHLCTWMLRNDCSPKKLDMMFGYLRGMIGSEDNPLDMPTETLKYLFEVDTAPKRELVAKLETLADRRLAQAKARRKSK